MGQQSSRAKLDSEPLALGGVRLRGRTTPMTDPSSPSIDLPIGPAGDADLADLPAPRRPGRRLTLVAMGVTALVALAMSFALRHDAAYALRGDSVDVLGNLAELRPDASLANHWVRGEALLSSTRAVRFARPLESDSYRFAQVAGNDSIWVQIRVPSGEEGPRFVPPTTFVGRLIPMAQAGLRYADLGDAVTEAGQPAMARGAWVLLDGESPGTTRWAIGLVGLFLSFAAFNVYGLIRLLRPVRDA